MRLEVGEIFPHMPLLTILHQVNHFIINLQQPESRRDIIRTDDKQVDSLLLGFHLCFPYTLVNVPLVDTHKDVQLKQVAQRVWFDTNDLLRDIEKNEHRVASRN